MRLALTVVVDILDEAANSFEKEEVGETEVRPVMKKKGQGHDHQMKEWE